MRERSPCEKQRAPKIANEFGFFCCHNFSLKHPPKRGIRAWAKKGRGVWGVKEVLCAGTLSRRRTSKPHTPAPQQRFLPTIVLVDGVKGHCADALFPSLREKEEESAKRETLLSILVFVRH
jgi:hypothetical protein